MSCPFETDIGWTPPEKDRVGELSILIDEATDTGTLIQFSRGRCAETRGSRWNARRCASTSDAHPADRLPGTRSRVSGAPPATARASRRYGGSVVAQRGRSWAARPPEPGRATRTTSPSLVARRPAAPRRRLCTADRSLPPEHRY